MRNVPIRSIPLPGASSAVRNAQSIYCGFTIRETSGVAAARVRLYDHATTATGTILEEITLAAGKTLRCCYHGGLWAVNGIYAEIAGAVSGSVRIS
ncbi:hypothetical protein AB0M95_01990 [Sphaerisporangium sp. NPDC051017]|uniref:hypothetical protein n=1 Tax=Sphaerisporangium sp. NPDC051017 TaxID=3154636 RepID=UPI00342E72E1